MFIKVKAINPGFSGAWRAGRFFDNAERVLEVVEGNDPKGPKDKDGNPSATQISKAGYEALKADGRFSFGANEGEHAARDAAVAALRAELADTQAELATAKMKIAELEHQVDAKGADAGGKGKPAKGADAGGKAKE